MSSQHGIPWKRTLGLIALAVYGPFLAMAIYALMFVTCSHCKRAAWTLLLPGPGLLPVEFARRSLDFSRPPDALWLSLALAVAFFGIAAAACLARRGRVWLLSVLMIALTVGSLSAVALLALIRA